MKKKNKEMTLYLACSIVKGTDEGKEATEEQKIKAWQWLHDTTYAYRMEDWFEKQAKLLIKEGVIKK